MSTTADVEHARKELEFFEGRVIAISSDLHHLTKELQSYMVNEHALSENLEFLRRRKVVASAAEFKKVRYHLAVISDRVKLLKADTDALRAVYHSTQDKTEKAKDNFNKALASLGDNVIEVQFGKKK